MPAFGAAYSDEEIASLANYVTARFGAQPLGGHGGKYRDSARPELKRPRQDGADRANSVRPAVLSRTETPKFACRRSTRRSCEFRGRLGRHRRQPSEE